jgi:hypothetical protein
MTANLVNNYDWKLAKFFSDNKLNRTEEEQQQFVLIILNQPLLNDDNLFTRLWKNGKIFYLEKEVIKIFKELLCLFFCGKKSKICFMCRRWSK